MEIFDFESNQVRVIEEHYQVWFVAKDVAKILGYKKPENAVATHVDAEDKTTTLIQGTGSNYKSKAVMINESGLYSLVLSSKLPTAKKFKHWVTSEVLPAIRKTGSYQVTAQKDSYMIEDPIERAKRWIQEQKEKERLEKQLKLQEPKVIYFNEIVDKKGLTGIRETGKMLKVGQSGFVRFLLDHHYAYRTQRGKLQAYSKYCGKYFEVKDTASGFTQTFVTPEGRAHFNELIRKAEKNDKSE